MSVFRYDQSYGRIVGVASTAVFRRLKKYLKKKKLPITPDQFRVLTHLWQDEGCSQQELALYSNRNRANVTRILDILEREDIVKRIPHDADRRAFKIVLTEKGKNLETAAAGCGKLAVHDALQGISEEEIKICMKVLNKTIENLK
jgi:DNA-binding MarR family transcriptional regulator